MTRCRRLMIGKPDIHELHDLCHGEVCDSDAYDDEKVRHRRRCKVKCLLCKWEEWDDECGNARAY